MVNINQNGQFDKALKNAYLEESMKRLAKNAFERRRNELIGAGVDKDVADVMAKVEKEYGVHL